MTHDEIFLSFTPYSKDKSPLTHKIIETLNTDSFKQQMTGIPQTFFFYFARH